MHLINNYTLTLYNLGDENNLLTPWDRALHEKLIAAQLVRKFPAFYGTQRFIAVCTRIHHGSLF
jgi:hypothetical protein